MTALGPVGLEGGDAGEDPDAEGEEDDGEGAAGEGQLGQQRGEPRVPRERGADVHQHREVGQVLALAHRLLLVSDLFRYFSELPNIFLSCS